ncbi:UrvD/REP family ATP-dependent DNA helicase [Arcanobacterium pinnipediorum]|uniref:DNA 3'-5' helicase n=1 Tax=Arcanobacterium pinnipediorum TaxID=1503041 RepID=A0ABY5AHL8_9ACTO|nr:UrvD/REP family ATP-dependent DNA helicase [Arcanobacterium pinnipediorum]USR78961.1 PD-(D/E)XK nuclease family protein [Arcanobacterium pinnipediorum]
MCDHVLDQSQQAVVSACEDIARSHIGGRALSVIGAASTGKTTLLRRCLQAVLRHSPNASIAVLSPDRRAADETRNTIVGELKVLGEHVRVRSISAFAFAIVSRYAQAVGRKEPELLSGPEQDALIKELFDVATKYYPHANALGSVDPEVAHMEAFRQEYRDLLTRSAELGITAQELRELAEAENNPSWFIGAELMEEYEKALAVQAGTGYAQPDRTDHARIVQQAAAFLQQWDRAQVGQIGAQRPQWDWIFVDDVSNSTLALRSLLRELHNLGANIVVFGDPDSAVQGYRGGIAHLQSLLSRPVAAGGIDAQTFVLAHRYRGGGQIEPIITMLETGIHVAGSALGRKADTQYADPVTASAHILLSDHDENSYLASRIRQLHLEEKVAYSQIAVVTRSRSHHHSLRQALLDRGVPVQPLKSVSPLRFQPVVADLILAIKIALGLSEPAQLAGQLRQLLTGPLFGLTPVELSSLIKRLHGWELLGGGRKIGDELLATIADQDPDSPAAKIPQFSHIRLVFDAVRSAVSHDPLAENVLWVAWEKIGKAQQWREQVLAGSEGSDEADRNLDAVIQLFRIAQRLSDRDPQTAQITDLLRVLDEQEIPEDSIARTSAMEDGIVLTSPSAAIGQTWEWVFIAKINEGIWPNLQLRNPLTQVPQLVSRVVGSELAGQEVRGEQRLADVVDDELRMLLYSVSRAKSGVEFTCVHSEDVLPSRFMDWLFPSESQLLTVHQQESLSLDFPTFVGQLRQAQRLADPKLQARASDYLAQLQAGNIGGMEAKIWADSIEYTQGDFPDVPVRISPSTVEKMLTCPLRGTLDSIHGQEIGDSALADLGTLIHQIAEETQTPDRDRMLERLDQLWEGAEFGTDMHAQQLRYRAEAMVEKLYSYLVEHPGDAHKEIYARVDRGDVIVSGKLDRVEYDPASPDEVRVVDFKTGKVAPAKSLSETVPQLLIYQWLVEEGGLVVEPGQSKPTTSLGARLVHVGTDRKDYSLTEQSPLDQERRALVENMIDSVANLRQAHSVPAIVNDGCRTCSYRVLCPAYEGKRIFS